MISRGGTDGETRLVVPIVVASVGWLDLLVVI